MLEKPETVNALLVEWLAAHRCSSVTSMKACIAPADEITRERGKALSLGCHVGVWAQYYALRRHCT
jgi:hypothetical protein